MHSPSYQKPIIVASRVAKVETGICTLWEHAWRPDLAAMFQALDASQHLLMQLFSAGRWR